MRRLQCAVVLTFASLVPLAALAQVEVTASVDEKTVGTEEVVRYTVEVRGAPFADVITPSPPSASKLSLVQRSPATQQNISIVNSDVERSLSFTWQYRPSSEGDALIAAAEVTVAGKTYKTEPIDIEIVPQSERPERAGSPSGRWLFPDADDKPTEQPTVTESDVFIRAIPNKRTIYENEQLSVDYVLFFRHGVLLRNSRLADSWDTEGFWREDLDVEQRSNMRTEIVDGLRYNAVTLKRVALFPTRSGELNIEPLRIETKVALPRNSGVFRSLLLQNSARFQSATVASPAISVTAKPLPVPPDGFRGAVGTFAMQTTYNRTSVEAGEPIQLTVTLSGRGNIATLAEPPLELPPLIERFGPEISDTIDRTKRHVEGIKSFTYTLVPKSGGRHVIPSFSIPYFDPETGSYGAMSSNPVTIRVTGSVTPAVSSVPTTRFPANDVAALHDEVDKWRRAGGSPLYRMPWPYAMLLLPALALAGLFFYRKRLERIATDERYARSRRAHPVARKHLKQAEQLLREGEGRALYEEIVRAVLGFVGDRLNIAPHGMTSAQLASTLRSLGIPDHLADGIVDLGFEADRARFSPEPPDTEMMNDVIERAAGLIAGVDEHLKSNRVLNTVA
jgi:hypothetical protein